MSAIGQPFWRDQDIVRAQRAVPLCKVCGEPSHLPPFPGHTALALAGGTFNVASVDLISPHRDDEFVQARAFAVWTLRTLGAPMKYAVLGRLLGGRDHSSIIHLHQRAIWMRQTNERFREACDRLEQGFYQSRIHRHAQ